MDMSTKSDGRPGVLQFSDAIPILHMFSPTKHNSPFDVNMAADAGYKLIATYTNVTIGEVPGLVQDAIFSRASQDNTHTGIFIGGKDAILALDMMDAAKKAMVPPFQVSTFADPAGSFTTAAAMIACVERVLELEFDRSLKDTRVAVFGATGVVGFASSVIAALEGARVQIVAHRGIERVIKSAAIAKQRFGVDLEPVNGESDEQKRKIITNAEVIFSTASAGVRVIATEHMVPAKNLLVVADVNAVPPSGVEGLGPFMDGAPLPGCTALAVGPFAIGGIKYKIESRLFKQMIASKEALTLDFRHAFTLARALTGLSIRAYRAGTREEDGRVEAS
jgi:methylene-tetrahydromethanopterin dehydrogenase